MPHITLDLVSLDNKPLTGLSRRFEGSGGTIGRDKGNTLALPDAHRRVSRLHAAISFPGGVPTITNSSSVLPIGVGGAQLECGQAMPLVPGMNLEIGPYVLTVRQTEAPARPAPMVAAGASNPAADVTLMEAPAMPVAAGADPFRDLLSGLGAAPGGAAVPSGSAMSSVDDPLARLFGSGASAAPTPVAHSSPPAPLHSPRPAAVIPDDFNPFDLPSAAARNTADPLASLQVAPGAPAAHALTQEEQSIDALFAPAGASIGDVLLGGQMPGGGLFGAGSSNNASLLGQQDSSDPLALFGGAPSADESRSNPMRDDLAEVGGAYEPPRAIEPSFQPAAQPRPRAAAAEANPFQPAAMPSYPEDALTRAFLAGANLPASALPEGLTPEIMTVVGSVLRSATAGAIEMLAVRASIKREVQAHVTIISSEANNPLKFLPDADSVLQLLLGKRMRGFMGPDEAMKDAFNDLRAHELGVMAGTRAALAAVLGKFDPTILGERLIGGSLLEKALPAMRKTKLWDLYLERYAQIRREVEDDFQAVFGKAFVAAYESETARMKNRAHASRPDEQR